MKYGFRPRDCLGNPLGENHISWYVPPLVNVLLQYAPVGQQSAATTGQAITWLSLC